MIERRTIPKGCNSSGRQAARTLRNDDSEAKYQLLKWYKDQHDSNYDRYNSKLLPNQPNHLYIEVSLLNTMERPRMVDGREVLNACFDANFTRDSRVMAFGEDVGAIGDVNQGFAGLQLKFGTMRIFDTGIREMTIIGQGIGLAMRGLRPIAEIQYLDYLLYALNILSDDLATLSYRTKGRQKAPLIIRTRGHRLEGIWHSGSPMGVIINSFVSACMLPRNYQRRMYILSLGRMNRLLYRCLTYVKGNLTFNPVSLPCH